MWQTGSESNVQAGPMESFEKKRDKTFTASVPCAVRQLGFRVHHRNRLSLRSVVDVVLGVFA